jgi:ubiquinol-cytochrome c reductase iron-sulfur subunit
MTGCSRRELLTLALAVPAGACARVQAAEETPVEVDIGALAPGRLQTVRWRERPVWILRRTPEMLQTLAAPALLERLADAHAEGDAPAYTRNALRSIRPEVFVAFAHCPHAGCEPVPRLQPGPNPDRADNWPGGFACQCHFATFDLAGRVFRDKPTRENVPIPRHMYRDEHTLVIGRDADGTA